MFVGHYAISLALKKIDTIVKTKNAALAALLTMSALGGWAPPATPAEMDLDHLLRAHTEAVGGASAIENVTALEIELRIEEPTFVVTGSYRATRDGRMRIDIFADDQRVFTEAFDGTSGWQLLQGQSVAQDMSPEGEVAVIHGLHGNIFGLHELEKLGYSLSLVGSDTVDDSDYWLVDSVSSAGFLKRYFINAETFLIERTREESALHPDVDAETQRFETLQFDYREQGGRLFSFRGTKTDIDTGDEVQSTEIIRLVVSPQFEPDTFEKPSP